MTGFDDLNEAGKEQAAADSQSPDDEPNEDDAASTAGGNNEPAFPFEESVQAQIYPRQTTHEAFEDFLDMDVKRHLRDREIRNETGRELHEAVLQVAMNHPEEIAEALEEQRRE
ncbi:MAG: hypothetical protein ACOCQL_02345 [Halolamina sp.]